jgi:hypothetical protein
VPVPGPGGLSWGIELLLFGGLCLPLGELIRRLSSRYIGLFRGRSPIERGLLDLYLAGGALYLLGWFPFDYSAAPSVLLALGAGLLLLALLLSKWPGPTTDWGELFSPTGAVLGVLALGLFALELFAAESAPTGNTFDSSIFSAYVGLTGLHHQLPTSFEPIASQAIAYPQGTTAWLFAAQGLFGTPPERTALLVTPLFLALAPVGAYLWGRSWWGSRRAGLLLAGAFVLLASWPRLLVSGSNDFVLSFPLVLLLWSWTPRWFRPEPPPLADAVGFGLVAGLAAALSPTGPELWFLALPIAWSVLPASRASARWARWRAGLVALVVALLGLLPSLSVVALEGGASSGLPSQIPSPNGAPAGLTGGQFVGYLDPFLFRPGDVWLSPFPLLRVELAALIVLGAVMLCLYAGSRRGTRDAGPLAAGAATFSVGAVLLALDLRGGPATGLLAGLTNAGEVSILLFTLLVGLAVVPLVRLASGLEAALYPEPAGGVTPPTGFAGRRGTRRAAGPTARPASILLLLAVGTLVVLPGLVVTTEDAPGYLHGLYLSVGNTTAADFALLGWAQSTLPAGARVLVAPGSAAQFLAGLRPDLSLVYPVEPVSANPSYQAVTAELENGTLDAAGHTDLAVLAVDYIAVTQANNRLWPAYSPVPLLAEPATFPLLFHAGDAYLFAVAGV